MCLQCCCWSARLLARCGGPDILPSPVLGEEEIKGSVNKELTAALEKYGIATTDEQNQLIDRYCRLLWDWNDRLNLTRHVDYDTFVARDVLDSMHLATLIPRGKKVVDIGSGGGVPGILLAIVRPDLKIWLNDSIEKKTRALADMVLNLELSTKVINARIQDLLKQRRFDVLVARAVGPTKKVLGWLQPHWESFDELLLIKGPRWIEERKEARYHGLLADIDLRKLASYPMPGTDSESVVLSFKKKVD